MSPNLSPVWVQVWVQLKKEKWFPISRKRHQIGHLDFRSFRLLTEGFTFQVCWLRNGQKREGEIRCRVNADELGLFDYLETPEVSARFFPTIPGGFRIARADNAVPQAPQN
jgi:hypothetical protein